MLRSILMLTYAAGGYAAGRRAWVLDHALTACLEREQVRFAHARGFPASLRCEFWGSRKRHVPVRSAPYHNSGFEGSLAKTSEAKHRK